MFLFTKKSQGRVTSPCLIQDHVANPCGAKPTLKSNVFGQVFKTVAKSAKNESTC